MGDNTRNQGKNAAHAAKPPKTKTRRRMRTGEIIVIVAVALIVLTAGIFCWRYFTRVNGIGLEGDVFMFVNGRRFDYAAPVELNYSSEEGSHLTANGEDTELYSRPVYYSEYNLILSAPFLTHDAAVLQDFRVPRFTSVYSNEDNEVYFMRGDRRVELPDTFLFDGGDTYIFLKTTTITVGERAVTVPPLSFAVVVYDRTVEIVNIRTGETSFEQCAGLPVSAVQAGCAIDLSLDIVTNPGDVAQILLSDVSILPEMP